MVVCYWLVCNFLVDLMVLGCSVDRLDWGYWHYYSGIGVSMDWMVWCVRLCGSLVDTMERLWSLILLFIEGYYMCDMI